VLFACARPITGMWLKMSPLNETVSARGTAVGTGFGVGSGRGVAVGTGTGVAVGCGMAVGVINVNGAAADGRSPLATVDCWLRAATTPMVARRTTSATPVAATKARTVTNPNLACCVREL